MTDQTLRLERNFRVSILVLSALTIFLSAFWAYWSLLRVPSTEPRLRADAVTVLGPSALCPGDTLNYSVALTVTEPGVFALDVSIWRRESMASVIFYPVTRMAVPEPQSWTVERYWRIPDKYIDPRTGRTMAWQPGPYERVVAFSAVNADTRPSIVVVPFTIREDCGEAAQ